MRLLPLITLLLITACVSTSPLLSGKQVDAELDECPQIDIGMKQSKLADTPHIDLDEWTDNDGWQSLDAGMFSAIACRNGQHEGENINHYYCEGGPIQKRFVDEEGVITDVVSTEFINSYDDTGTFRETRCVRTQTFQDVLEEQY